MRHQAVWTALVLLLLAAPVTAQQRFAWQQEADDNTQAWTFRIYYADAVAAPIWPAVVDQAACIRPVSNVAPATYDCTGVALEPLGWATAYLTAENALGESLPSNVVTAQILLPAIPSAPKHFRRVS